MGEIEENDKRIRGFAGLINSVLSPLNDNKSFKEKFSNINTKILINAVNLNFAALIIIDFGTVRVESIPNKPKSNLNKKNLGWNAFLEMDTQTFLAIAMNRISLFGVMKMWITGKIKMRGLRKLLILLKMIKFLTKFND